MEHVFIPPQFDPMFKRIFADSHHLEPLKSFLSAVLDLPEEDLTNIQIADPHVRSPRANSKVGIVDVRVRTTSGRDINVEIQRFHETGFRDRLVFYGSSMLAAQLESGQPYNQLAQTITVAITNFSLIQDDDTGFHHRFRMYDEDNHVRLSSILQVDTLELPKLPAVDDGTLLWKWLRFISVQTRKELDMVAPFHPIIADAADRVLSFSEQRDMYLAYLSEDRAERDQIQRELDAESRGSARGEAAGLARGLAKGVAEGRAEGMAQGMAQGRAESARETARRALDSGLSPETVADIAGLPVEEVLRLV